MKSAILINGVTLPHHVIDTAIQWAITTHSSLKAVFVYQSSSKLPYYEWPRDKAITRFMSGDLYAEGNLIELIDRHVQYTSSCCALSSVICEVSVMKNATLPEVVGKIGATENVFADRDTFDRLRDFAYTAITSSELDLQYKDKINWCRRNNFLEAKRNRLTKIAQGQFP